MTAARPICVAVLAHNEERRIEACLRSLPLGDARVAIHVVVNGSTDRTATIARAIAGEADNLSVHEYAVAGKAHSWNRFLFDWLDAFYEVHVFVDGDAVVVPGSIDALAASLRSNCQANAASALPMNGRRVKYYQQEMRLDHGLFGDLYALRGRFLEEMKVQGIRLPDDLVGDDGLICAMAKTDLKNESNWRDARVVVCETAGFLCEPVSLFRPEGWRMQYRRMISYSIRHFQNAIIGPIMRTQGPRGLPQLLSPLYADAMSGMCPRVSFPAIWFDHQALRRMRQQEKPDGAEQVPAPR
jgi:glycosyltransferase involved in cell wall biosynthesis